MRKKGFNRTESPEKTSAVTSGIEMTRGGLKGRVEKLTGGNGVADESGVGKLIRDFMENKFKRR